MAAELAVAPARPHDDGVRHALLEVALVKGDDGQALGVPVQLRDPLACAAPALVSAPQRAAPWADGARAGCGPIKAFGATMSEALVGTLPSCSSKAAVSSRAGRGCMSVTASVSSVLPRPISSASRPASRGSARSGIVLYG
jgi:hypothetical protein